MARGYPAPKDNPNGGRAPGVNDDISARYEVTSRWVWGTKVYTCTDNTRGAAVWIEGASGGSIPAPGCIWPILTADASLTLIWGLLTFDSTGNIVVDSSGYPVLGAC